MMEVYALIAVRTWPGDEKILGYYADKKDAQREAMTLNKAAIYNRHRVKKIKVKPSSK